MSFYPEIRKEGLTMRNVGDDLIIYDATHRCAHRLNQTSANILLHCDGTLLVKEIASLLPNEVNQLDRENTVWLALEAFAKADLLVGKFEPPKDFNLTRRQLLKKAGVIALSLPIIESIIAPTPAEAGSRFTYTQSYTGWR